MDKKAVVYIHNGVLAIKKNTFESVLMRWMKLEPIIQIVYNRVYVSIHRVYVSIHTVY